MKYVLFVSIASLALACSDGDTSNADAGDAAADVRVVADGADAGSADRVDAANDVTSDQMPDASDATAVDLPAPAMLEITPAVHDFGMVMKDNTVTHHFTVKNTGGSASGSLDMKLMNGDLDPDAFASVANGCDSTLEPEATCEIEIRFAANVLGMHQGLLTATASPGGMASAELKATVP
jgi:hypothetical protein